MRADPLEYLGGGPSVKARSSRRAVAQGRVSMSASTASAVASTTHQKGDVLGVARVSAIQAAKKTSDLLPMCRPVAVGGVQVNFTLEHDHVVVEVQVDCIDRAGVQMEALFACSVACLCIYDMCKSGDPNLKIEKVVLLERSGGMSGDLVRDASDL